MKRTLNNRNIGIRHIARLLWQYRLNVRKPTFVISQGNVTKLASLSGAAVLAFINDRFGLTLEGEPATKLRKMASRIKEKGKAFHGLWVNKMNEALLHQYMNLGHQKEYMEH